MSNTSVAQGSETKNNSDTIDEAARAMASLGSSVRSSATTTALGSIVPHENDILLGRGESNHSCFGMIFLAWILNGSSLFHGNSQLGHHLRVTKTGQSISKHALSISVAPQELSPFILITNVLLFSYRREKQPESW